MCNWGTEMIFQTKLGEGGGKETCRGNLTPLEHFNPSLHHLRFVYFQSPEGEVTQKRGSHAITDDLKRFDDIRSKE